MEQNLLNQIYLYLNNGNLIEALNLLQSSEKTNVNDSQYWEISALTQGMSGNHEECKNACLKAIKLNPNNIGTYINLGVAQQSLGLLDEAVNSLKKAHNINNNHPQVHNNLGSLYILQSEYSKAKPFIEKAISIDPKYSDAHSNLAEIHKYFQNTDRAIESYLRSIELNENNINAYVGLGSLYTYQANYKKSEYYLNYALKLNPYHSEALFNLGFMHYLNKSYELASTYFKKTIELNPDHQYASYLLSAITGQDSPEKSPESYVKGLFDHYAETFDEHLVNDLKYNVPVTMHSIFIEFAKPVQTKNLLDLGCGTGICGEKFNGICTHITGVDLSEKMIEKAREKNVYNKLHTVDIYDFINNSSLKYDLVIAADVFIYIGNIREIVKTIYSQQEDYGYFLFSIEKSSNHENFHLRSTGRYSHSVNYIQTILNDTSYNIIKSLPTIIRNEKGIDIDGIVYLCQKQPEVDN